MSVKTTPIITDVVLLLLLTVGIGNLSTLMGAYEVSDNTYSLQHLCYPYLQKRQNCKTGASVSTLIGNAFGELIPSVLLNCLTVIMTTLLGM